VACHSKLGVVVGRLGQGGSGSSIAGIRGTHCTGPVRVAVACARSGPVALGIPGWAPIASTAGAVLPLVPCAGHISGLGRPRIGSCVVVVVPQGLGRRVPAPVGSAGRMLGAGP